MQIQNLYNAVQMKQGLKPNTWISQMYSLSNNMLCERNKPAVTKDLEDYI